MDEKAPLKEFEAFAIELGFRVEFYGNDAGELQARFVSPDRLKTLDTTPCTSPLEPTEQLRLLHEGWDRVKHGGQ